MSKADLQESLQDLKDRQEELLQYKTNSPDYRPKEVKSELESVNKQIASIEAELKKFENMETNKPTTVAPGTEKLVQIEAAFGNRFSARTGKEINKPQPMLFSFGEWQLFKQSYKRLGYQITKVINDPYGDAASLVEDTKD